ncbi:NAD-binding protein [uncultured Desulfobulbus sp.]|uniref:NAD-binding protein n=1 Tax=uncultured Desulfobulbus sp. TaxID=239745 RepID=UPI0029C6E958|nr:NAD-binding protein [uncultured Desulfobulbus sp.]
MNKSIVSLFFLVAIILLGATGYHYIERFPVIDALYMAVITISTVGFGEIYPLSTMGRLFTIGLILVGFVVLGFFGSSLVELLMERVWSGKYRGKKMKKQINRLKKHHIICGFGRVGKVAVQHLSEAGASFVVIDSSAAACEQMRELGYFCIEGDATRESILMDARIKEASGLLALMPSDPHNLFIALNARELNPTLYIIARSEDKHTEKKILKAGADAIICPFDSAGRQIADNLLAATGGNAKIFMEDQVNLRPEWIIVQEGSGMINKTIGEIARSMRHDIIGLRRSGADRLQPPDETVILQGDQLLIISERNDLTVAEEVQAVPQKIVIIDDNPVIVRLYARLFQKAGFHPLTADSGDGGLALILKEKPAAAVVDFMLPGLSGLEVCRHVRQAVPHESMKLVVFTADDTPLVREQCLAAGADEVIVKSSEASQIIGVVSRLLHP